MSRLEIEISPSTETGKLQIMHLKRFWGKTILKRDGKLMPGSMHEEWQTDVTLLNALGLGLEQTMQYVYSKAGSFDEFENWIIEVTGGPDQRSIDQFNRTLTGEKVVGELEEENVLTPEDHKFWRENGYIIIRHAAEKEDCEESINALCDFIGINRYDSATWYNYHPERKGIMIQLFQHPALQRNRTSFKIRKAFEELWGRKDIWVNTDRVGFNPPENETHKFQGPRLHWDVSLKMPMPFGTQGILYLADTAANQGAFTLVPGFNNRLENWLNSLPEGANPRQQDLYALGPVPIAANAGDFILWSHRLPHGASPNISGLPRFVQYINYQPSDQSHQDEWI